MNDIQIAIVNRSTVVTDDEAAALTKVLQKQVDNDFAPVWGCPAALTFVPLKSPADPKVWWLTILDDSDQAGDLGYHDLTPAGLPLGKAFAKTDLQYKTSWTVTVSHELLEMLADPNINLTVFDEGPFGARLYSYEVCDACEDDQFGYRIDGTLVSDFVYPSWFESFRAEGSTQFDFGKHLAAPLQLLAGGYIGVNDIASGLGWQQAEPPQQNNARARPAQGSRRQRRGIPLSKRTRSVLTAE